MELSIAGQNMSGKALQWAFAQLGNHAEVYADLRREILDTFGYEDEQAVRPMTWEHLKTCSLLQGIIAETLRIHPVVPTIARTALRDTILPTGAGTKGRDPIAVPKGATFNCNLYLMQRRVEEWGADASEWMPRRWVGRKAGPEYAP
jgi:cytochrome P450